MPLTPDEEQELTYFNCLAFDIARKEATERGQTIPCWLVTSPESRQGYRERAVVVLNQMIRPIIPFALNNIELIEKWMKSVPSIPNMFARWREAEISFKERRNGGADPWAFFAS